ncbi:MAG: hypothetical protein HY645_05140 [Acidobacteria bacterium]|nr:hypothetical protein [Acidobacteriota bacterium]
MRHASLLFRAGLIAALSIAQLTATLFGKDERYRFNLDFGYRWKAGFRGSKDLYRSQLDLGEGPKLLAGDFFVSAPKGSNRWFDRVELRMNSWGGEPYNSAQLRAAKAELYELFFSHRNVQYFNAIPFFANPLFEQGVAATQHHFDISHRFISTDLRLRPQKAVVPFLSYHRAVRQGPVRTSLVAQGDEFVIHSQIETHSDDFSGGVELKFDALSLLLEQGMRRYRDKSAFDSLGFQGGNSPRPVLGRDITLERYLARNDWETDVPFTNVVLAAQPHADLNVRGKFSYSMSDLEGLFRDEAIGTFFGRPESAFFKQEIQNVSGRSKQPSLFADVSADWRVTDRIQILEHFYTRRLHISGSAVLDRVLLQTEPLLGPPASQIQQRSLLDAFLAFDQDVQELQGIVYFAPRLSFRVGHRFEQRNVELAEEFSYNRNVAIAGVTYEHSATNRISAEYEYGHTTQAVFRLDPVDFHRARVRGRLSPINWLELNGSITLFDNRDPQREIDWTSRDRNYTLQVGFTPHQRVTFTAEYERSNLRSNIIIIVPQTFTQDRSVYRERGDYGSALLSVQVVRGAQIDLGYSVWGTVGSFPMSYHQPMARLEIPVHKRLVVYGQWNHYDYNEKQLLLPQDYRVHLALFGLRILFEN